MVLTARDMEVQSSLSWKHARYSMNWVLRIRKSGEDGSNMKIVGPIIKLKSEQFKSEALNLSF